MDKVDITRKGRLLSALLFKRCDHWEQGIRNIPENTLYIMDKILEYEYVVEEEVE